MSQLRGYPNKGLYYSNIVKPIKIDCNFVIDSTNGNGLGIRSLKSNGYIENVFMHTSATPGSGTGGFLNPNPAAGYALIQLKNNFNYYLGGFSGFVSPTTGSPIAISGSGLTANKAYFVATVGAVPDPSFTVTTVADVSKSLASKYFLASDALSNNYVFYNVVSGTGTPPALVGALANYVAVPVAFATNATNSAVATAVGTAMAAVNGGNSWTASPSTNVVTVTSTANANLTFVPLPNAATSGFAISAVTYTSLAADWQHVGYPVGFTPAVGGAFIAKTTGGALGTGTAIAAGVSGIECTEVVGDPNQTLNNSSIATNSGAQIIVQFLGATSSSVTTLIPTAPANGSVAGMSFFFDGSSVTVDGL